MKRVLDATTAAVAFLLCLGIAHASDLVGVYAKIDKIVLEPTADHPQRLQISGVVAMSKPKPGVFGDD